MTMNIMNINNIIILIFLKIYNKIYNIIYHYILKN